MPKSNGSAALALAGFILLSTPAVSQWVRVSELGAAECTAVISSGDTLYAGAGNTVYRSTDAGASWTVIGSVDDPPVTVVSFAVTASGIVAGTLENGLYVLDSDATWIRQSDGLTGPGSLGISSLAVRDSFLYAGTLGAGVFRRIESGPAAWTPFRDGLLSNVAWTINSLENLDGMLIAGAGSSAFVYRNLAGETEWEGVQFAPFSPLGTSFLAAIEKGGMIHGAGSQGLHRSSDSGSTWTPFDPAIGYIETAAFAATPSGLYALLSKAGASFLFRLESDDSSWVRVSAEPGPTFAMAASGSVIFAAKLDGLWKFDLSQLSAPEDPPSFLPGSITLEQNYPNPFNPATEIRFALPRALFAELKVYTVLGEDAGTLLAEYLTAGTYTITWNAAEMPSGVYFYRLSAGGDVQTRRMLLTR